MNRTLFKDFLIEIKKSYKRFISILLMAMLGVGFFVGIKAASPNMKYRLDDYFDNENVFDLKIVSTSGLTTNDVEYISKLDSIKKSYGAYETDVILEKNDIEYVLKTMEFNPNINQIELIKGNFPERADECVVEKKLLSDLNLEIGDTINIQEDASGINNTELKIVGIVESPLYISVDRGTSKLGSGKIDYFIYISEDNVNSDIYTSIYIVLKGSKKLRINKTAYDDLVKKVQDDLKEEAHEREELRYEDLVNNAVLKMNMYGIKIDEEEIRKNIEMPKWYVLDRKEANLGYMSLMQDSQSVDNLSKVFPLIFFIVATLMSLTSMTRMIDEQRTEIGTLKALGYSKLQISGKYILYSAFATLLGSILGSVLGYMVIPTIVITAYLALYNLPPSSIVYDYNIIIAGMLVALFCIVGGAVYSSYRKLRYEPSKLMRPKSPIPGKRVIIEKMPFIWNKLTFLKKVTLRNIFRYKKRFLMTIIGIAGATALIVVGFGIKNSVSKITSTQYKEIYKYQMTLTLKNSITKDERKEIIENIENNEQIKNIMQFNIQNVKILKNGNTKDIHLMIIKESEDIEDFITLRNNKTKKKYSLDNEGVIITKRISKILGIKKGDIILIKNENDIEKEVLVSEITEHYISHYIYITDSLYKKLFSDERETNIVLIKTLEKNKNKEQEISKELLKNTGVFSVTMFSLSTPQLDKTMDTLNLVVLVLIISAGLLTFVVLYSLSNVNISERTRELATLKVLGFYDKEVNQYINREMVMLTIIGILIGLVSGYYLTLFVLRSVEQELVMYPEVVEPISYIYSVLIVVIFTFIINIFSYFVLKKISMIQSLKSVE